MTEILQVVKVNVSEDARNLHLNAVALLGDMYFSFARDGGRMPEWPAGTFGNDRCPDLYTLKQTMALRKKAMELIDIRQNPLPKCKQLLPNIVALWNVDKDSVDTISYFISSFGNPFRNMGVEGQCWIRLLNTALVQLHLLCCYNSLPSGQLQGNHPHTTSMRQLRTKSHEHASLKTSLVSTLILLRSKVTGQASPIVIQPLAQQFVVPVENVKRKTKLSAFNTQLGRTFRCANSNHLPVSYLQRGECIMCKNSTLNLCEACNVRLCTNSNASKKRKHFAVEAGMLLDDHCQYSCFKLFHYQEELLLGNENDAAHDAGGGVGDAAGGGVVYV
jgi:hypothetical protein